MPSQATEDVNRSPGSSGQPSPALPACDNPTYESSENELESTGSPALSAKGRSNSAFDDTETETRSNPDSGYSASGDPLEDLRNLTREISPGVMLEKVRPQAMSDYDPVDSHYPAILDSTRYGRSMKRNSGLGSSEGGSRPSSFYSEPESCGAENELEIGDKASIRSRTYFGFTGKQWLSLFVFGFANVFSLILINLQAPFYPQVAEEKGASQTEIGFVFGSFELVVFCLSPILGNYMDRLGPKKVFNVGILVTSFCSVLFGFLTYAESHDVFIGLSFVIRIIEAAGAAAHVTASFTLVAVEFPDDVFTVFAAMETCSGVGLILGPLLGSILYDAGSSVNHEFQFLLPFVTLGGILFVMAILAYFIMPVPHIPDPSEKKEKGHGFFDIIRVPSVALAAFSIFSAAVSIGYNAPTLEPHIKEFELASVAKGCIFIINGGTYALIAPFIGKICDRTSKPKHLVLIGALLICAGFTLQGPAPFFPFEKVLWVLCIGLFIQGLGLGCAFVSAFTQAMKDSILAGFPDGVETYGLVAGLWMSMFALGNCVGPSVAGLLVDAFDYRTGTVFVMALQLIVAAISFIFILREGRNGTADINKESELEIHSGNGVAEIQGAKFFSEFTDVSLTMDTMKKKDIT